ncbi:hypothetical protein U1Q18_008450 [Sarracenia purpurea var. burkii]
MQSKYRKQAYRAREPDSEHSRSLEKIDISPVSSTGPSGTKKPEDGAAEALTTKFAKCDMIEESLQKMKRLTISRDLEEDNVSSNQSHYSPKEHRPRVLQKMPVVRIPDRLKIKVEAIVIPIRMMSAYALD